MNIKKLGLIIDKVIEKKKSETIKRDDVHYDSEMGYREGFINALEILKELTRRR